MNVIEPLIKEHQIIQNTLDVFEEEVEQIQKQQRVDLFSIETSIDFIRTYADLIHHGKEENILFRELQKKNLAAEQTKIMNELAAEHQYARRIVRKWLTATESYFAELDSEQGVIDCLQELTTFYPRHIAKEHTFFSGPVQAYFTQEEQNNMIREFEEFELNVLTWKYGKVHSALKKRLDHLRGAST